MSFQRLGKFLSETNPVVTTFTLLTLAGCEMQFQQVRFIGHSGEIRRPLYSFSQHLQWEGSCIIAIICHPLQKWMATNYHYDNGCLNSWCWCQRSIIWLSHIKDHQATTFTDLHPSLVLVCLLDRDFWTQLGLEGECSVKAVIEQRIGPCFTGKIGTFWFKKAFMPLYISLYFGLYP